MVMSNTKSGDDSRRFERRQKALSTRVQARAFAVLLQQVKHRAFVYAKAGAFMDLPETARKLRHR